MVEFTCRFLFILKTIHLFYTLWGFGVTQSHWQFWKHFMLIVICLRTTGGHSRATEAMPSGWNNIFPPFILFQFLFFPDTYHGTCGQGCSVWLVLCPGPRWWPGSESQMKQLKLLLWKWSGKRGSALFLPLCVFMKLCGLQPVWHPLLSPLSVLPSVRHPPVKRWGRSSREPNLKTTNKT